MGGGVDCVFIIIIIIFVLDLAVVIYSVFLYWSLVLFLYGPFLSLPYPWIKAFLYCFVGWVVLGSTKKGS